MRKRDRILDSINYKEVGKLEMTKEAAINLFALSIVALFVFRFLFLNLYALLVGSSEGSFEFNIVSIEGLAFPVLIFAFLFIITFFFHEFIHGVFVSKYGGKPRYGMGIAHLIFPYFYATSNTAFRRNQFIVIALAPLVVISLLSIILMIAFPTIAHWMLIPLALNSAGAVGDLWMTIAVLRYPEYVLVEDNIVSLTFYGKQSDNPLSISTKSFTSNFLKGFTIAFTIIVLISLIFQIYFSFRTGNLAIAISFAHVLPLSGFAGLAYSIIKSTITKKDTKCEGVP